MIMSHNLLHPVQAGATGGAQLDHPWGRGEGCVLPLWPPQGALVAPWAWLAIIRYSSSAL